MKKQKMWARVGMEFTLTAEEADRIRDGRMTYDELSGIISAGRAELDGEIYFPERDACPGYDNPEGERTIY